MLLSIGLLLHDAYCRCGFAQSQEAYDNAVNELFGTMDMVDNHLGGSRYLCGDKLTLADVCLFTTLIRFDIVYNVLFKCTKKKLVEYPNLHGYMRDIYQVTDVDHPDMLYESFYQCAFVCMCLRYRKLNCPLCSLYHHIMIIYVW